MVHSKVRKKYRHAQVGEGCKLVRLLRNKIGTLQDRPPSPFREPPGAERVLTTSPSRQLVGRTFSDGSATRTLQPPESPRLGRRGLDSMRELPPLSPSLSRRALSPVSTRTAPDPKLTREVAESPRPRRWAAHGASPEDFSLTLGARSRRTRSPSPTLGESLGPRKGSFSGRLSPAYSLGSLTGASPRQSPRAQRKLSSGDLRVPVTRERKNSITETLFSGGQNLKTACSQHLKRGSTSSH